MKLYGAAPQNPHLTFHHMDYTMVYMMKVAIHEAKAKLSALIKATLAGEQVILTKHGQPVAEIKPFSAKKTPAEKLAIIEKIVQKAKRKATKGVSAAKADNFLYDDDGLPS